jgi:hypothetical protein
VLAGSAVVHLPVVTATTWSAVGNAIGVTATDGTGSIVVYVEDAAGPAAGAVFDPIAGAIIAPFYDAGGALVWRQDQGTGAAGVALFRDVPPGTHNLAANHTDARSLRVTGVSVGPDRVTVVRALLGP